MDNIWNKPRSNKSAKTTLLSDGSKIFDPLGWLASTIKSYKILLQIVWIEGRAWDQELLQDIETEWLRARKRLSLLENVKIPKCILPKGQVKPFHLHIFTDASEAAYAAVVYTGVNLVEEWQKSISLQPKRKLLPIKTISFPRSELNGAFLVAQLVRITPLDLKQAGTISQNFFLEQIQQLIYIGQQNYHELGQLMKPTESQQHNRFFQEQSGNTFPR